LTDTLPEPEIAEVETDSLVLRFAAAADPWSDIRAMQQVDEILRRHECETRIVVEVPAARKTMRRFRSRSRCVEWCQQLEEELRAVSGLQAVRYVSISETRLAW
jgi:hypothetical protein